jgi:DNA-binding winged helix-turn-helix (wHTH) protein
VEVRFGAFVFDEGRHLLTRDGEPLELSPKAFTLLTTLLARRPGVVRREDLHDLLWPDAFVGPTSLPRLVSEVRAALRDDAASGRLIRTVHSVGYAFAGEVAAVVTEQAAACTLLQGDTEIPLRPGITLIGRGAGCQVRLPSPRISRVHARIVLGTAGAVLEDLGSKNGSHVEGRRVEGRVGLHHGDRIVVGPVVLTFLATPMDPSTETDEKPAARD